MKCPVCKDVNLVMTERQGVEIDYCPSCRGVWLDRGELDKIIDRSAQQTQSHHQHQEYQAPKQTHHESYKPQYQEQHYQQQYNSHNSGYNNGHYKKKKEGFLSDLFDFD